MENSDQNLDAALHGIDEGRRATLRRLIVKGAFVAPIVASFAMSGLTVERAAAQTNSTSSRPLPTSDRRLKRDVARIATHPAGFGIYRPRGPCGKAAGGRARRGRIFTRRLHCDRYADGAVHGVKCPLPSPRTRCVPLELIRRMFFHCNCA
jgi:hypothetical protein